MSIKKTAQMAGFPPATVSRALNNPEYQCKDPAKTEAIRQAARKLGYTPNLNARNLKLGMPQSGVSKPYVIDILLARYDSLDKDPFFCELFRCIETELQKMNCIVGQILNISDVTRSQPLKNQTQADGLMILGKCPFELAESLIHQFPGVIAIDRNPMDYKMDEVICNGSKAAYMAIEYLIGLGHTKIAYIGDCNMEARYMGYYECLTAHSLPLAYDYIIPTNQTQSDGYRAFHTLRANPKLPTAVFCANDITAIGFLNAMKESNGRKRKHIYAPAVISIDDIREASNMSPLLTTVRIPKEDMAHMAILTLIDRLNKGHREYIRLELPCRLMIRETS